MDELETIQVARKLTTREKARKAQQLVLALGFDAKLFGLSVIALIPMWESNIVSTLQQMGWEVVKC